MAESDGKKGGLAGMLGWGGLALATAGFIWFISTQLAVQWAGREKEALELARNHKAGTMRSKLDDHKIEVQNAARQKGDFVGQFSWSTVQGEGSVYKVTLTWMEGSAHKRATWNVDLKSSQVEAADDAAKELEGRSVAP